MTPKRFLILDYETRSLADLKKVGGYEYASHASTRLLCVGWRVGTRDELRKQLTDKVPARIWSPAIPSPYGELKAALLDPSVMIVAHNAFFEQVITRFVLARLVADEYLTRIPHNRWICTASLCRAHSWPGKLELAVKAMALGIEKDMEGHRLMRKLSKPRKPTKNNPALWHNKKADLLRVMEYCRVDVDAETEIFLKLPPLIPFERKVWLHDQRINFRGFRIDRDLVAKALKLIAQEVKELDREMHEISAGRVRSAKQRDAFLAEVRRAGLELADARAKTIEDTLALPATPETVRRLLEIRQGVSMSSTAKYAQFWNRTKTDGRCRDSFVYHQAAPTGRFAGAGAQPQNFPRGKIKGVETALELIQNYDLEFLRCMYRNPSDALSAILRNCIVPSEGKEFFCGDFAMIEVCVLFWVADHQAGLRTLRDGGKLYEPMAGEIYHVPADTITKEDPRRQVGKETILGGGFGMGAPRFVTQCADKGIVVAPDIAEKAIKSYRKVNAPVVKLWSNLERAAIAAVLNPGKAYTINHTRWFMKGTALHCELASGRHLVYQGAHVRYEMKFNQRRPKLRYFGLNLAKKWVPESTWGGKLTENIVQAYARELLVYSIDRLERAGYEVVLHAHDENLAEKETGKGSVEEFSKLMAEVPAWGRGIPVKVETWKGTRYKK